MIKFPFVQIYSLFKWLILDTIGDIKFIFKAGKKISNDENVLNQGKVDEFKKEMKDILTGKINMGDMMKRIWLWLLVIAFAMVMGYMIGVTYCEIKCNNYIAEEFYSSGLWEQKDIADSDTFKDYFNNVSIDPLPSIQPMP